MRAYRIYLSFNNLQEVIELPVLPEKITVKQSGSNKAYDLLNVGEINVIKGLKLPELAIESEFPADDFFVTSEEFYDPMYYVEMIQKWAATLRPIRLTMTGTIELSWPVSIEDFQYTEEGGKVGDISYALKLKKYLFYGPGKVTVVDGKNTVTSSRTSEKTTATTITVRRNEDTFWIIAKKYLGDGSRASELAKLNGMNINDVLCAGKTIRLS